jgi:hypothetical protein
LSIDIDGEPMGWKKKLLRGELMLGFSKFGPLLLNFGNNNQEGMRHPIGDVFNKR